MQVPFLPSKKYFIEKKSLFFCPKTTFFYPVFAGLNIYGIPLEFMDWHLK